MTPSTLQKISRKRPAPLSLFILTTLALCLVAFPVMAQGGENTQLAQTVKIQSASSVKSAKQSMEARYQEVLRTHFAMEPTIREVQDAAIRYASAEPERARSWFSRSNIANIAPRKIQVRYDRDFKENSNATSTGGIETSARADIDDDAFWQLTAEWDFSRLVFNPDTVRVATQAMDLAELREDVLNAVTKLYYERRALRLELILKPPTAFEAFTKKRLRIDELTSDIDALTGGAFSKGLKK